MARKRNPLGKGGPGRPENLRVLTSEQARECGKIGGKASAIARRRARDLREIAYHIMGLKPKSDVLDKFCKEYPEIDPEEMTHNALAFLAQLSKAEKKGDTYAYTAIMKTLGVDDQLTVKSDNVNKNIDIDLSSVKTDDLLKMVEKVGDKIEE